MTVSRSWTALLGLGLALSGAQAAPSFDDLLGGAGAHKSYVQPLADAATQLAGSGSFHGARSKGIAGLDLGVKLVLAPVSSGDVPAGSILDQSEVKTVGLPMLTASKGLIKGLQVGARYLSLEASAEVGKLDYLGASLRFELNELFHVPILMPRIGLQADWNRLRVGEAVTNTTTGLDLIVSKSFVIVEPYAGLSLLMGKTALDYHYDHDGELPTAGHAAFDVDSDALRLAAGINITPFPLLRVNVEAARADFTTVTAGVLLSLF